MELLWSVQLDGTDTVEGVEEDVIGVILRIRFWYWSICGYLESISVP